MGAMTGNAGNSLDVDYAGSRDTSEKVGEG